MPVISAEHLFPLSLGMTQPDHCALTDRPCSQTTRRPCTDSGPASSSTITRAPDNATASPHLHNTRVASPAAADPRIDTPPVNENSASTLLTLPEDVQQILVEVARTGSCTSLAWSRSRIRVTRKRPRSQTQTPDTTQSHPVAHLQQVFYMAMTVVLDHSYNHRGGYRITPLERTRLDPTTLATNYVHGEAADTLLAQTVFLQRRQRLVALLLGTDTPTNTWTGPTIVEPTHGPNIHSRDTQDNHGSSYSSKTMFIHRHPSTIKEKEVLQDHGEPDDYDSLDDDEYEDHYVDHDPKDDRPPFTIQRIAEILLAPERYYQQTHKLCNALEKLLLVTSPSTAFGGVMGGDTSQNTREVQELAALANEKDRLELEHRHRRRRRRKSSFAEDGDYIEEDMPTIHTLYHRPTMNFSPISEARHGTSDTHVSSSSSNLLISTDMNGTDTLLDITRTGSMVDTVSDTLPGSYFSSNNTMNTAGDDKSHDTPIGSIPEGHASMTVDKREDRMEFIIDPPPTTSMHSSSELMDPYNDVGRSYASYSDIDSESGDDISYDDSASDKSDGSEGMMSGLNSGNHHPTGTIYSSTLGLAGGSSSSGIGMHTVSSGLVHNSLGVPYGNDVSPSYSTSAARIMAWNRMHQQHRREQYLLQSRGSSVLNPSQPCSPSSLMGLSDSDYQSGDSIDSMMAEDSEGSESSSSDA